MDFGSAWWCDDVRYGLCPCSNYVFTVKKDLTNGSDLVYYKLMIERNPNKREII